MEVVVVMAEASVRSGARSRGARWEGEAAEQWVMAGRYRWWREMFGSQQLKNTTHVNPYIGSSLSRSTKRSSVPSCTPDS
jgi:hypothetical protein